MSFLTPRERQALQAVCDTLVPAVDDTGQAESSLASLNAAEFSLADQVEQAIVEIASPSDRRLLRVFLRLLEFPAVNLLLGGKWTRFSRAPLHVRTRLLRGWSDSRLALRRQAFQALKRLALFLFYTAEPDGRSNPTWSAFGYEPAPPAAAGERRLSPLEIRQPTSLQADVVVVGSGAGGGVVAAELAAAGKDVLILEKGIYADVPDFHGRELRANRELFERQGGLTTSDMSVVVLAGSAVGGGTLINWSTSLPTPEVVRSQWARRYGFEGVDGREYDLSLERVQDRIHVDREESEPNQQNSILERGGAELDVEVEPIARNVDGCVDCTYCFYGCRHRAKQSTLETYLPAAARHGARIVVRAHVDRIRHEHGRVCGVEATVADGDKAQPLTVHSQAVVVAAGAVHSPALLLRSGIRNRQLGRNLRLHPVTAPVGIYDEPVRSWQGPPQTRLSEAFADLDGRGHGFRLEVAPAHPGLWASALPWTSGREHKNLMSQLGHLANIVSIVRDQGSGRVTLDDDGQPQLHYPLDRRDVEYLVQGTLQALRLHRAAGARVMLSPHNRPERFERGGRDFEGYLRRVAGRSYAPNDFGLFSAHQMGTCRVAGDRSQGVVRPDGESWDLKGLYLADGSVFPTACGVNPMIPIMATSHFLAQRIKAAV